MVRNAQCLNVSPCAWLVFHGLKKAGIWRPKRPCFNLSSVLGPDFALSPSGQNDLAVRNSHGPDMQLAIVSVW